MKKIPFKKKKIDGTYLVWFENSNSYTQLEEPAWFVFKLLVQGYKAETVAKRCAERYNIALKDCIQFVNDIAENIKSLNKKIFPIENIPEYSDELQIYAFNPHSSRIYSLADKVIEIRFENSKFESYIHPLIGHLETLKTKPSDSCIDLFKFKGQMVIRLNGKIQGVWSINESNKLIGSLYMIIINQMFEKTDDFWLMTVHASAITNGQKTILLPAASGSGKTTLAALLQKRGFQIVSDDFVPIDKQQFKAWPFPTAMSVKEGSMEALSPIFPELHERPTTRAVSKKIVRYLAPEINPEFLKSSFPVTHFISVSYNPDVDFEFKKSNRLSFIKLLLDQSWILPGSENAQLFMEQVANWSFYELIYSNNQKALDAIAQLFADE